MFNQQVGDSLYSKLQPQTLCPECGSPVCSNDRFCADCGQQLGKAELLEKAGIVRRLVAEIIDRLVMLPFIVYFFPPWIIAIAAYSLFCDGLFSGRSIGKKAMGLRVVCPNEHFTPCSIARSIPRNFIRSAAFVGYSLLVFVPFALLYELLELLFITFHKEGRRIGDLFANTVVITEECNQKLRE